ncbi:hypothetical protein QBC40DRAFT_329804 [Triangularia verruculosa]|uniref:Uncharacterized protein n=1 Tax=Triangularia verruculosa TaxID=2587418 RepID=A0AAN6XJP7_9PEZI|nr:hypothetical protein QBC40DRAFT_329804 [Triangularia verruculosa]
MGVGQDPKDTRRRSRKPTVTVCHICGDRVRPQLYCPSCGHPLCGRCKIDTAQQSRQEPAHVNGAGGGEQHRLAPEDGAGGVSVAVAAGLPSPVATTPPDGSANTKVAGKGERQMEVIRKSNGEIVTVEKRWSVKTNPFVIADQIAKAKVSDPQVSSTTIHVIATPPGSKPPKYDLTAAVDRKRRGPDTSSDAAEHPRTRQSQYEPHLRRLSHSYASSSRGSSVAPAPSPGGPSTNSRMMAAAEEREKERAAALHAKSSPHFQRQDREPDRTTPSPSSQASNDRTQAVKQQAKREQGRSTPPVLRRVKVLAQRDKSRTLQQVLQVDVDSGVPDNSGVERGVRDSAKSIPRVRVTSPPAWLKGSSAAAAAATQPGSIAGRLRRVDADKAMDSNKTKSSPQLYQPIKEKEERGTTDSTATVTVIRSGQAAGASVTSQSTYDTRGGGFGSYVSPRATMGRGGGPLPPPAAAAARQASQHPRSYPFPPMQQSTSTATGPSQQPQSISFGRTAFGQQHSHGSGFWKVPSSVNMATSKITSEATVDGSRIGGVHRSAGSGTAGTGTMMVEGDDDDDVGIQGLTIVLHLRGKDDLVISTDLTREGGGGGGGGEGNGSSVRSMSKVGR